MADAEIDTVNELLDRIDERHESQGRITIATVQEIAGSRVGGPLLLVPGLTVVSPLSGIPTLPTLLAAVIGAVSVQLLVGRRHIWLPRRLREAGISSARTTKAIAYVRPIASFIDRMSSRRFSWLAGPPSVRLASLICLLIALMMPAMEFLPFSSSLAGVLVTIVGLALMTGDGLLFGLVFVLFVAGSAAAVAFLL